MSQLEKLKNATSLHDVAHILGFKPKSVSYILYIKPPIDKYKQFEIPKRSGGKRLVSAPYLELKSLQRRLSELLQNCMSEINETRNIKSALSHGFRRKHSIITNASNHRNKRYVFNIDLENFFGSINFGRVRGFFIANRNLELNPDVATVLAQIACHENSLPQGSPCSPVISNLIGHIVDIHLSALASREGCTYSRYADDLTFSTNKQNFPTKLAKPIEGESHQWQVGNDLKKIIEKAGFKVNNTKTRMQYRDSRQDVTGLVVNAKVNTRIEYRRKVRAMVHRLLKTGSYQIKQVVEGNSVEVEGTLNQLNGMLGFIDSVCVHNKKKSLTVSELKKKTLPQTTLNSCEKIYKQFLIYKNFYASPAPLILCEGKTDNIYIKAALKSLVGDYPRLTEKKDKVVRHKVKFFQRTDTTGRILALNGGSGELVDFIKEYLRESRSIVALGQSQPVILLIDNDSGAKGIFEYVKNSTKIKPNPSSPFIFVSDNIYIVPTPLTSSGAATMIEDFFESSLLKVTLKGKTFNPDEKPFDSKTQYGKAYFAEHVVKKNESKINFVGFKPLLDRIDQVIIEHSKKVAVKVKK